MYSLDLVRKKQRDAAERKQWRQKLVPPRTPDEKLVDIYGKSR